MSDERPKLILTEDDLGPDAGAAAPGPPPAAASAAQPPTQQLPAQQPPAQPPADQQFPALGGDAFAPPRVLTSSDLPSGPGASLPINFGDVKVRSLIAASVGIVVGWAICEITGLGSPTATSESELNFKSGLFVGVLGLAFAVIYN